MFTTNNLHLGDLDSSQETNFNFCFFTSLPCRPFLREPLMTVDTPLLLCGDHGCALIAYAILGAMTQYRPKFSFNAKRRNYDAILTCFSEILSLLFACQISQKYFPYFLHARFLRNTFLTFCMPDFSEILSLLFACQIFQQNFPYFLHARFLRNTF